MFLIWNFELLPMRFHDIYYKYSYNLSLKNPTLQVDVNEDTLNHGNISPSTVSFGFALAHVGEKKIKCEELQIRLIPQSLLCNMLFSVCTKFRCKDVKVLESFISSVITLKSSTAFPHPHGCQSNSIPLAINRIVKKDERQKLQPKKLSSFAEHGIPMLLK